MFNVICLETGELERAADGTLLLFSEGREAAKVAGEMSAANGKRYKPRPVKDDTWREREQKRLDDGTYTRLPWDDGYPEGNPDYVVFDYDAPPEWHLFDSRGDGPFEHYEPEAPRRGGSGYPPVKGFDVCAHYKGMNDDNRHHFAHVSNKTPGTIAFTASAEKGAADIQTVMRPGRYLTQFYGHVLSAASIKILANQFIAAHGEIELKFATTADEIEQVYTEGPRSCMSHDSSSFESNEHPARVYAAGDIACAYLVAKDEQTHITARALCWPEKKLYGRTYGDDKITSMLDAAGYTYSESALVGARMLKIEQDGGYVVPYVDNVYRARVSGKYLIIDPHGEINCETTNGLAQAGAHCPCCGDMADDENFGYVEDAGESWCEHCCDRNTFYCEYSNERYSDDAGSVLVYTRTYGGRRTTQETWSQRAADRHAWQCEETEEYYSNQIDGVTLNDGRLVCQSWFDDNGYTCEHCGECFEDGDTCGDCPQDDDAKAEHKATQGRDESPAQVELPLIAPFASEASGYTCALLPGDLVVMSDITSEGHAAREWRAAESQRGEYGTADGLWTVVNVHTCGNVDVRAPDGRVETWERAAFVFYERPFIVTTRVLEVA
jgi:hypothetical protein